MLTCTCYWRAGLRADSQRVFSVIELALRQLGDRRTTGSIMAGNVVYVTSKGLKKLKEELEFLRTVKRKEVAQRLHEAMEDGELIENAEYEAAKNEQAFVEGRILELDHLIAQAKVIERGKSKDRVQIGSTVTVKEDRKKPEVFTIVGAAEANPKEGLISNESPLGRALLDHKVGDKVEVQAPAGTLQFSIVKIK
jgi:transcription elongation factor GreA